MHPSSHEHLPMTYHNAGRKPHPRRSEIMESLRQGKEPKEVAYDFGIGPGYPYKMLRVLGMITRFITREEWEDILSARRNTKTLFQK